MSTLPQVPTRVHSNPDLDPDPWHDQPIEPLALPAPPSEADALLWAEVSRSIEPAAADPDLSDLAWLQEQAAYHFGRSDRETSDLQGLVSTTLASLARSLRFQRISSAAGYALRFKLDLDAVALPGYRGSALAGSIDVEASWYLHLDTDAGTLAAHELLNLADLVERMGSQTVEDFLIDEAAWRAAAMDAVCLV